MNRLSESVFEDNLIGIGQTMKGLDQSLFVIRRDLFDGCHPTSSKGLRGHAAD